MAITAGRCGDRLHWFGALLCDIRSGAVLFVKYIIALAKDGVVVFRHHAYANWQTGISTAFSLGSGLR